MNPSRVAVIGVAAVLAVGLASLAVVLGAGGEMEPLAGPEALPVPQAAGEPPAFEPVPLAGAEPGREAVLPPSPAGVTPPSSSRGARKASPPGTSWDVVPAFPRPSNFGAPLAPAVAKGLEDARSRMEPCFEDEVARENARPSRQRASDRQNTGPALLVLRMEAHLDALEVVDTEVERNGDSSPALVGCCRKVLAGFAIDAPGAMPGQRYRLMYPLQP